MGADDWKLTFLESFSAEGDYIGHTDENSALPQQSEDGASQSPRRAAQDNGKSVHFSSPKKERSVAGLDSSNNSLDFVQVNLQDLNSNRGHQAGGAGAEEDPSVNDGRSEVKGHGPSLKQLAAAKKETASPRPHISDIIGGGFVFHVLFQQITMTLLWNNHHPHHNWCYCLLLTYLSSLLQLGYLRCIIS